MTGSRKCHRLSPGGDQGLVLQAGGAAGAAPGSGVTLQVSAHPIGAPKPRSWLGSCVQVYAEDFHLVLLAVAKTPVNSPFCVSCLPRSQFTAQLQPQQCRVQGLGKQ